MRKVTEEEFVNDIDNIVDNISTEDVVYVGDKVVLLDIDYYLNLKKELIELGCII